MIPPFSKERGDVVVFGALYHFTFNIDSADRTDFSAFTAGGTTFSGSPFLVLIHNNLRFFAALFEVKRVGSFNFVADAYASGAEYASVAVNYEEVVCGVDFVTAPVAFVHDVVYAMVVCCRLEFTVFVSDAD
jgi:hypothetical protein